MFEGTITDVRGIRVGHAQNHQAMTGCTFIGCNDHTVGAVDMRGGGPGTRETDAFSMLGSVPYVHGVMLSGGSAYGLASCDGAMAYLEEQNIGFDVQVAKVPIVGGAVLFDLGVGDHRIRPDFQMGYQAAKAASDESVQQGSYGAGTGATVGKRFGDAFLQKSGLGSASMRVGKATVGAIFAVNALGDLYDYRNGEKIAGACDPKSGEFVTAEKIAATAGRNTTIGVIATDAKLDKCQTHRLCMLAHDGLAMAIRPVHTPYDGDTAFALSTAEVEECADAVYMAAAEVCARAVYNAVMAVRQA